MTPQSIRRAAKVLRREANQLACWSAYAWHGAMPAGSMAATTKEDHAEMLDLARQLERLAKGMK